MNAHIKENCVKNKDSTKLPMTGLYAYFVRVRSIAGAFWPVINGRLRYSRAGAKNINFIIGL